MTPANRVEISINFVIGEKDYDIESYAGTGKIATPTEVEVEKCIAPNVTRNVPCDIPTPGMTDEMISQIKSGAWVLYFFGDITYDDVFGQRHKTQYCYTVDPSTWQLKIYRQHNRME